jgi:drug/metabolite transporter (DMT)-like permease
MKARDMVLAALTSIIWGFGFVAIKFGLESFSVPQLTAVRSAYPSGSHCIWVTVCLLDRFHCASYCLCR